MLLENASRALSGMTRAISIATAVLKPGVGWFRRAETGMNGETRAWGP